MPHGRSIGVPTKNVEDFLGAWKISWTGSVGTDCPCQGTLTIDAAGKDQLIGYWETRSGTYVLRGNIVQRPEQLGRPFRETQRSPPTSPSKGSFS